MKNKQTFSIVFVFLASVVLAGCSSRERGSAGKAMRINDQGKEYLATGRSTEALALFEEALPIMREAGDRSGEAVTLTNMGAVYDVTGRPAEALALYEEALSINREVDDRAGEAAVLHHMALLLSQMERVPEAIEHLEQALNLMSQTGLTHDGSGTTVTQYEELLQKLHEASSKSNGLLSPT